MELLLMAAGAASLAGTSAPALASASKGAVELDGGSEVQRLREQVVSLKVKNGMLLSELEAMAGCGQGPTWAVWVLLELTGPAPQAYPQRPSSALCCTSATAPPGRGSEAARATAQRAVAQRAVAQRAVTQRAVTQRAVAQRAVAPWRWAGRVWRQAGRAGEGKAHAQEIGGLRAELADLRVKLVFALKRGGGEGQEELVPQVVAEQQAHVAALHQQLGAREAEAAGLRAEAARLKLQELADSDQALHQMAAQLLTLKQQLHAAQGSKPVSQSNSPETAKTRAEGAGPRRQEQGPGAEEITRRVAELQQAADEAGARAQDSHKRAEQLQSQLHTLRQEWEAAVAEARREVQYLREELAVTAAKGEEAATASAARLQEVEAQLTAVTSQLAEREELIKQQKQELVALAANVAKAEGPAAGSDSTAPVQPGAGMDGLTPQHISELVQQLETVHSELTAALRARRIAESAAELATRRGAQAALKLQDLNAELADALAARQAAEAKAAELVQQLHDAKTQHEAFAKEKALELANEVAAAHARIMVAERAAAAAEQKRAETAAELKVTMNKLNGATERIVLLTEGAYEAEQVVKKYIMLEDEMNNSRELAKQAQARIDVVNTQRAEADAAAAAATARAAAAEDRAKAAEAAAEQVREECAAAVLAASARAAAAEQGRVVAEEALQAAQASAQAAEAACAAAQTALDLAVREAARQSQRMLVPHEGEDVPREESNGPIDSPQHPLLASNGTVENDSLLSGPFVQQALDTPGVTQTEVEQCQTQAEVSSPSHVGLVKQITSCVAVLTPFLADVKNTPGAVPGLADAIACLETSLEQLLGEQNEQSAEHASDRAMRWHAPPAASAVLGADADASTDAGAPVSPGAGGEHRWRQQVAELQDKLSSLEAELLVARPRSNQCKELEQELQRRQQSATQLAEELEQTRAELEQQHAEKLQTRSGLQQARAELARVHAELEQTCAELEQTHAEWERARVEVERAGLRLEKQRSELEQQRAEVERRREECREGAEQVQRLTEQLAAQHVEVEALRKQQAVAVQEAEATMRERCEAEASRSSQAQLEKVAASHQKQFARLPNRFLGASMRSMFVCGRRLEAEHSHNLADMQAAHQQAEAALKAALEQAESEAKESRQAVQDVTRRAEAARLEVVAMREQCQAMEADASERVERLQSLNKKRGAELEEAQSQLFALRSLLRAAEGARDEAQAQQAELSAQLEAIGAVARNSEAAESRAGARASATEQAMTELQARFSLVEADALRLGAEVPGLRVAAAEKLALEYRLAELQAQVEELQVVADGAAGHAARSHAAELSRDRALAEAARATTMLNNLEQRLSQLLLPPSPGHGQPRDLDPDPPSPQPQDLTVEHSQGSDISSGSGCSELGTRLAQLQQSLEAATAAAAQAAERAALAQGQALAAQAEADGWRKRGEQLQPPCKGLGWAPATGRSPQLPGRSPASQPWQACQGWLEGRRPAWLCLVLESAAAAVATGEEQLWGQCQCMMPQLEQQQGQGGRAGWWVAELQRAYQAEQATHRLRDQSEAALKAEVAHLQAVARMEPQDSAYLRKVLLTGFSKGQLRAEPDMFKALSRVLQLSAQELSMLQASRPQPGTHAHPALPPAPSLGRMSLPQLGPAAASPVGASGAGAIGAGQAAAGAAGNSSGLNLARGSRGIPASSAGSSGGGGGIFDLVGGIFNLGFPTGPGFAPSQAGTRSVRRSAGGS
ncbi:hypothetical protein V8C86DRAFT_2440549 [Haematococcus lacustris]